MILPCGMVPGGRAVADDDDNDDGDSDNGNPGCKFIPPNQRDKSPLPAPLPLPLPLPSCVGTCGG